MHCMRISGFVRRNLRTRSTLILIAHNVPCGGPRSIPPHDARPSIHDGMLKQPLRDDVLKKTHLCIHWAKCNECKCYDRCGDPKREQQITLPDSPPSRDDYFVDRGEGQDWDAEKNWVDGAAQAHWDVKHLPSK